MKLIKPSYEIITTIDGEQILADVERAARTCYKSEGKIEYEYENDIEVGNGVKLKCAKSARALIPKLIARGHEAMLEFGGMITVLFICDRGVSHELVRHRIASFAQESTRYCNYGKDEHINFIIPCWLPNLQEGTYHWGTCDHLYEIATPEFINCLLDSESRYNALLGEYKWSPQEARSVLPNALKTEINVSTNIRDWRHIFKLRTAASAHPQMRELMVPLLREFQQKIPILFDDITV